MPGFTARFLLFSQSDFGGVGALPSGGASSRLDRINGRTCNWHHFGTPTPSKRKRMVYICGGYDPQNQLWVSLALAPLLVSVSQPPCVPRRELFASQKAQGAAVELQAMAQGAWQTVSGPSRNEFPHLALNLPAHHQNVLGPGPC